MPIRHLYFNAVTVGLVRSLQALALEFRWRRQHLRLGLSSYASRSRFGQYNTVGNDVALNNVVLGDYTYIANSATIANTTVGKFCSIAPGVQCGLGKHPATDFVSTHPAFFSTLRQAQITFVTKNAFTEQEPITIGNDVWIGANAIIVDGIQIHDGAIIAAGAVVTKDVPAYAIVGGVPASIIRYRFDAQIIEKLLQLRWWDRGQDWLSAHAGKFTDAKKFVESSGGQSSETPVT